MNIEYTTSDSEQDEDYDPLLDSDSGETSDETITDDCEDLEKSWDNILRDKDEQIKKLKEIIDELSEIINKKAKITYQLIETEK
jgi:hypothetical protein